MANALFMVPNPINTQSRDSVDTFIGRDWIAVAGIKFRQTGQKSRVWVAIFPVLMAFEPVVASTAPRQRGSQQECDRQTGQRCLSGHCSKPRQGLSRPLRGLDRRPQPVDGDPQALGHLFDRPRDIGRRVDGALRNARRRDGLRYIVVQERNSGREGRGSHLWLSARARVLNSGSEDLWLSATGAV